MDIETGCSWDGSETKETIIKKRGENWWGWGMFKLLDNSHMVCGEE